MLKTDTRQVRDRRNTDRLVNARVVLRDGVPGHACVVCGQWLPAWGADAYVMRLQRRKPVFRANPNYDPEAPEAYRHCIKPDLRARGETHWNAKTVDTRRCLGWQPTLTGPGCPECFARARYDAARVGSRRWPTLVMEADEYDALTGRG